MLDESNCEIRKCIHFLGIKPDEGDEDTDREHCRAFPDEIPPEIAYGPNLHLSPYPGDHGIQYEKANGQENLIQQSPGKPGNPEKFGWVTIGGHPEGDVQHKEGQKVFIDEGGNITAGPEALVGKNIKSIDENVAGTDKDERKQAVPPQQESEQMRSIQDAYLRATGLSTDRDQQQAKAFGTKLLVKEEQYGARAYLHNMRKLTPELSRKEFDELMLKLEREQKIVLFPLDDPQERTQEIDSAAIPDATGFLRQIVYIEGPFVGPSAAREEPKRTPPSPPAAKEEPEKIAPEQVSESSRKALQDVYLNFSGNEFKQPVTLTDMKKAWPSMSDERFRNKIDQAANAGLLQVMRITDPVDLTPEQQKAVVPAQGGNPSYLDIVFMDEFIAPFGKPGNPEKFGWVTTGGHPEGGVQHKEGTPMYIEKGGNISKGPEAIKGKNIKSVDRDVAGTAKDQRKAAQQPQKPYEQRDWKQTVGDVLQKTEPWDEQKLESMSLEQFGNEVKVIAEQLRDTDAAPFSDTGPSNKVFIAAVFTATGLRPGFRDDFDKKLIESWGNGHVDASRLDLVGGLTKEQQRLNNASKLDIAEIMGSGAGKLNLIKLP